MQQQASNAHGNTLYPQKHGNTTKVRQTKHPCKTRQTPRRTPPNNWLSLRTAARFTPRNMPTQSKSGRQNTHANTHQTPWFTPPNNWLSPRTATRFTPRSMPTQPNSGRQHTHANIHQTPQHIPCNTKFPRPCQHPIQTQNQPGHRGARGRARVGFIDILRASLAFSWLRAPAAPGTGTHPPPPGQPRRGSHWCSWKARIHHHRCFSPHR